MADSKKYDGSQWEHSLRKLTTATEAVKNPLYSDGTAITAYTIKGNTVQNGTPTPSAPISVNGVGTLDNGQYKIPISSPAVTTNIDLGSTQTVRQIKKYVMTGNEAISNYASDFQRYVITIPTIPSMGTRLTPIICTHYTGIYDGRPAEQVPINAVYTGSATDNSLLIKTDQTTDRNTFIAWLQEQYTNGTPVTIWYAVSTPETAAVNEPLMKIGNYADTLSNATAIPTTEGANSITVDTTVQPSEFTATWTGWHDSSVKEWDGSDWQ